MSASTVRNQLIATTLLLVAAALFVAAALSLNELATGWTVASGWTAILAVVSAAAAVGPWLWSQTVRGQRLLIGAVVIGSCGGLLGLLPGMSYAVVMAAQAALTAGVCAEASARRNQSPS